MGSGIGRLDGADACGGRYGVRRYGSMKRERI